MVKSKQNVGNWCGCCCNHAMELVRPSSGVISPVYPNNLSKVNTNKITGDTYGKHRSKPRWVYK